MHIIQIHTNLLRYVIILTIVLQGILYLYFVDFLSAEISPNPNKNSGLTCLVNFSQCCSFPSNRSYDQQSLFVALCYGCSTWKYNFLQSTQFYFWVSSSSEMWRGYMVLWGSSSIYKEILMHRPKSPSHNPHWFLWPPFLSTFLYRLHSASFRSSSTLSSGH